MVKKKQVKKPIDMDELKVHIAVGSIHDDAQLAAVIKACTDVEVLKWACKHAKMAIRKAAARRKDLPFGELLKFLFLDKSKAVRQTAGRTMGKHHHRTLLQLISQFDSFPQTQLPLGECTPGPTACKPEKSAGLLIAAGNAVYTAQHRITNPDEELYEEKEWGLPWKRF